jgi:hypothetical protein
MAQEMFDIKSLLSLSGATAATMIVCNTVQSLSNVNPRWLAFLVAQAVVLCGTWYYQRAGGGTAGVDAVSYVIAALNGCLVYCSAVGANQMTGTRRPMEGATARSAGNTSSDGGATGRRTFWATWW